jgi:hypothetical protein
MLNVLQPIGRASVVAAGDTTLLAAGGPPKLSDTQAMLLVDAAAPACLRVPGRGLALLAFCHVPRVRMVGSGATHPSTASVPSARLIAEPTSSTWRPEP